MEDPSIISDQRVRILGAGPSGLAAGLSLAKAGYEVEVFEKERRVGARFHGDIQGLENWSDEMDILERLRRMDLRINFDCRAFHKLTVSNMSREYIFTSHKPPFYLVKRGSLPGSLDMALLEQAQDSGVCLRFGETIPEEEADIIATGPLAGRTFGALRGIAFLADTEDTATIILGDSVAYKGYSYVLVTQGYGCLCTLVFGKLDKLDRCFKTAMRTFSELLDLGMREPHDLGGIGSFSIETLFERGGRLYVGEAAGIQDPLWGFGVMGALTSGYLAARSIIKQESYSKTARAYFGARLKAGVVNRFLWETLGFEDYSLILDILGHTGDIMQFLLSFHNHNHLQRALYPLALRYLKTKHPNLAQQMVPKLPTDGQTA